MNRKDLLTVYVYNLSALMQGAQAAINISAEVGDVSMTNYMILAIQPIKYLLEQIIEELKAETEGETAQPPKEEPKSESLDDLLDRLGDNGDGQ